MKNYIGYQLNQEISIDVFWLLAEHAMALASNPDRFWVKKENIKAFESALAEYGFEVQS